MSASEAVALLAAGWVGFAYAGYPLILLALRALSPRPVRRGEAALPVSVVIAVHDGERELAAKLENTLAQDAPGPLEVLVASDGSTDGTEAVARRFGDRGVVLLAAPERQGKEAAQARAIAQAKGEVLVFTDVSARLEPGALRALLRPFADPAVGCVSSEDRVEGESGEGAYVRYEMALRQLESEVATLVGVSGSCFAARRDLCTPWPTHLASDFRIALETARRGLRAVAEPGARVRFTAIDDSGAEWSRKVRTVQRGIAVLVAHRDLLHPRFGRAALALWGHKLARFTSPFALLGLLGACAAGAGGSPVLAALLGLQLAVWLTAGAAVAWPATAGRSRPARLAGFFALVNASMLVAWARYASGQRAVVWAPTRR